MKSSMVPGIKNSLTHKVQLDETVPHLFGGRAEIKAMPEVLASGNMIGLMECCCIGAMAPHLDEGEGSLGVAFNISHEAATPVGLTVTVEATLEKVEGRLLTFAVTAHDGVDVIGRGTHGRMVVGWEKFIGKLAKKTAG